MNIDAVTVQNRLNQSATRLDLLPNPFVLKLFWPHLQTKFSKQMDRIDDAHHDSFGRHMLTFINRAFSERTHDLTSKAWLFYKAAEYYEQKQRPFMKILPPI